jgi:putative DNA primase/helicase
VYRPMFKLWMSTNHKPEIPDGSEAIWDRMRLIPFTQRFEGKDADAKLPGKLREELPGVLAWAVRGCVEWVAHGLGTSKAVDDATAEYRSETDPIERFFVSECEFGEVYFVTRKALRAAWERWSADEDADYIPPQKFTALMRERGVVKIFREGKSLSEGRGWRGIRLRSDHEPPSPEEVSMPKKSCKQAYGESSNGHFSENRSEVQSLPPNKETFERNDEEVSIVSISPHDDYIEPPNEFEVDDTNVEYGTGEKE